MLSNWRQISSGELKNCVILIGEYDQNSNFVEVNHSKLPQQLAKASLKRKSEFLAGREISTLALKKIAIKHPYVGYGHKQEPIWPVGSVGSISHSEGRVVVICARDTHFVGLGIDIESVSKDNSVKDLANIIGSDDEYALMYRHNLEYSRNTLIIILFSAKEAVYKASYPVHRKFLDFYDVTLKSISKLDKSLNLKISNHIVCNPEFREYLTVKYSFIESMVMTICVVRR